MNSPQFEHSIALTRRKRWCERRMLRFDFETFFLGTAISLDLALHADRHRARVCFSCRRAANGVSVGSSSPTLISGPRPVNTRSSTSAAIPKRRRRSLGGAARERVTAAFMVCTLLSGRVSRRRSAAISSGSGSAAGRAPPIEKRLASADFVAKAAEEVVAENRARLVDEKTKLQRLQDALATLGAAQ